MGLIYIAINRVNQKIYVGKTSKTLEERRRKHVGASKYEVDSFRFHRALLKHGERNFSWRVLEDEIEEPELGQLEAYYIDFFSSYFPQIGYNMSTDVSGLTANSGKSAWNKGKKTGPAWNKGMKMNDEFREKCSKAKKGGTHATISEEARKKIGDAHRGKVVSAETRKKMSEAAKMRKRSSI